MSKPAGRPRRNHIVPRTLLAGFTAARNKRSHLWCYDKVTGKLQPRGTNAISVENDLYLNRLDPENPVMVEQFLGELESAVSPLLRWVDETGRLPPTKDLTPLLEFVATLMTRHTKTKRLSKGLVDGCLLLAGAFGWVMSGFKEFPDISRVEAEEYVRELAPLLVVPAAMPVYETLKRKTWSLLRTKPDTGGFITSDVPVVVVWRGMVSWTLLGQPGAVFYVPLSSTVVLVGTDSGRRRIREVGPNKVCEINALMFERAERFVYAAWPWFQWVDRAGAYHESPEPGETNFT